MNKRPNKKKKKELRPRREIESEALGVSFTIPERPNLREQLAFQSASAMAEGGFLIRFWYGALELIQDWKCERLPEPRKLNLDSEDDSELADIVRFVGNEVSGHMVEIGSVPKNG